MSIKAGVARQRYRNSMIAILFRVMAMFALMLMPHGLEHAPVFAQASAASADHCTDQETPEQAPEADCALSCSATAAMDATVPKLRVPPQEPRQAGPAASFSGVVVETATPPPKRA